MNYALDRVAKPGAQFKYEYDFGTTTELRLKVVAQVESAVGAFESQPIVARNEPLAIDCECGKPALYVCQCGNWLCAGCAEEDECGEEGLLPVVNSPASGYAATPADCTVASR